MLVSTVCLQDIDRFSPAWWFPDVPASAIVPLTRLKLVRLYLRQVRQTFVIDRTCYSSA